MSRIAVASAQSATGVTADVYERAKKLAGGLVPNTYAALGFYEARELVGFDRFRHVQTWLDRGLSRPAVQRRPTVASA